MSAPEVVGCTLKDGWDVSVPLDVARTDAGGAFHDGGGPECLPPTGRGSVGPIRIARTTVEVEDTSWRPVVWVGC